MKFHFHKWTHDSQGAEYCARCRKFRRWMPGEIKSRFLLGTPVVAGWGYLLNGPEWKASKDMDIQSNGGYYFDNSTR